jgi:hypothetical protein
MSDQDYNSGSTVDSGVSQLYDRSMEEALIGAVLIAPVTFLDVSSILQATFFITQHQWIWQAFTAYSSDLLLFAHG